MGPGASFECTRILEERYYFKYPMILSPTRDEIAKLAEMARAFNDTATASEAAAVTPTLLPVRRRFRHRLSPDAIDQLVRRYSAGESTMLLSNESGIFRSGLSSLLRSERGG